MIKRLIFGVACLMGLFALLPLAVVHAKENAYDKMARELSEASTLLAQPKIAIMPFSYFDKRKSEGGTIVSERLTTRMVQLKKCKIIERQLLESVLQELHLETTGIVDAETTKQLGKVLGVEAIITGTILDVENGMVEVNARVIKTETAEVITTSSVELKKIWSDVPVSRVVSNPQSMPYQSVVSQQSQQPVQTPFQPLFRGNAQGMPRGYCDLFFAGGSGNMTMTLQNYSYGIRETDVGLDFNGSGSLDSNVSYTKIKFNNSLTASAFPLIGFRMGGFGKYWGGGLEMSYFSQYLKKQKTTATYNDLSTVNFTFFNNDYLKVHVITLLSGDIYFRFSDKIFQPYIGMGIGMTLNTVTSPYIYYYKDLVWTRPLSSTSVGFLFKIIPIGARVVFSDVASGFVELRSILNTFSFDRNRKSEKDSITLDSGFFLMGLSFKL